MSDNQQSAQYGSDENSILQQLAVDYMREKRRKRRWGIAFKSLFALLAIIIIFKLIVTTQAKNTVSSKQHTALIDITGPIFPFTKANADNVARSLRLAYQDKNTQGIILRINSPGGSAVQADYIYNEIMRYRELYPDIKVYAVCTDACNSAAYYIAAAAHEIYADQASLIGSIGVIFNGFGFVDSLEKLGIERRLVTAGKYKGFMDPFSPVNDEEEIQLKTILKTVHKQFENKVRAGRGDRLSKNADLFSGLIWVGTEAKELGLIDAFGSPGYVAREVIKEESIIDYTIKPSYWDRLGMGFGNTVSSILEKYATNSYAVTSM